MSGHLCFLGGLDALKDGHQAFDICHLEKSLLGGHRLFTVFMFLSYIKQGLDHMSTNIGRYTIVQITP